METQLPSILTTRLSGLYWSALIPQPSTLGGGLECMGEESRVSEFATELVGRTGMLMRSPVALTPALGTVDGEMQVASINSQDIDGDREMSCTAAQEGSLDDSGEHYHKIDTRNRLIYRPLRK